MIFYLYYLCQMKFYNTTPILLYYQYYQRPCNYEVFTSGGSRIMKTKIVSRLFKILNLLVGHWEVGKSNYLHVSLPIPLFIIDFVTALCLLFSLRFWEILYIYMYEFYISRTYKLLYLLLFGNIRHVCSDITLNNVILYKQYLLGSLV